MKEDSTVLSRPDRAESIAYGALLEHASRQGLRELTTRIVQYPDAANGFTAIVSAQAVATSDDGRDRRFVDLGEASAERLAPSGAARLFARASTRAKSRVLRDLAGVAKIPLDEPTGPAGDLHPPPARIPMSARAWQPGRAGSPINDYDRHWLVQMARQRGGAGLEWLDAINQARTDEDFRDICAHLEVIPLRVEEATR